MNEINRFINSVWGKEQGYFRVFHDTDKTQNGHNFKGSLSEHFDTLTAFNDIGFGVFFIPNNGGQLDDHITEFNALYIDLDADKGQTLPVQWHVQPSYILQRNDNFHVYWLLECPNNITATQFTTAQKQLIQFYNSDKAVNNPSRVMRLPGFKHQKDLTASSEYSILFDNSLTRYPLDTITSNLPLLASTNNPPVVPQSLPQGDKNIDEVRLMLSHIDAGSEYNEWVSVGMGLKHHFHDAPEVGFSLFNEWSASSSREGVYNVGECRRKWDFDIKPQARDGKASITLATVCDMALKVGYRPSSHVNPAEVFGRAMLVPTLPVIPDPIIEFNDLPPWFLSDATSHTGNNAMTLHANYYGGRLYGRDKSSFWWTGERHQRVTDKQLSRSISDTLVGGEQHKENIVNGTTNLTKLHAKEIDQVNPPCAKVYFKNGYIDYESSDRTLKKHVAENFNTYTLPFEYEPNIPDPIEMLTFLNDIFSDDADCEEKILAIQEVLGWALIGDTLGIQKGVVLRGVTRGGKGTVLHVLSRLLGNSNFVPLGNLKVLNDDKVKSSLRDTNIAIDFDAKSVGRADVDATISMINKMTSNEPTEIKLLYSQDPWTGPLNCKFYMACNALPMFIDDTGAIVGRFHQIMFNKSALGREDTHLTARLDKEIPAIGNWAVKGLERLVANRKFTVPESTHAAFLEASESSQPLVSFVSECLVMGSGELYKVHIDVVFARWRKWCDDNNVPNAGTRINFTRRLLDTVRSQGVTKEMQLKIDGRNKAGFVGVTIAITPPSLNIVQ